MRKVLFIICFTLINVISLSQTYPTYFAKHSYWNANCDYYVKGQLIGKKTVGYIGEKYKDSITAVKIKTVDKYGCNVDDIVWIYPDTERYFNRQNRIDTNKRDTLLFLHSDDVNYESCFYINYDRNNYFKPGQLGFYRFRKENDYYVYSLGDIYFSVIIVDNKVDVEMNKWTRLINKFKPFNIRNQVSVKRFERNIRKLVTN